MTSLPPAPPRRTPAQRPDRWPVPLLGFPQGQSPDFIETLRKLWRYRALIVVCTILGVGAGTVAALSIHRYYTAEAEVLIGVPAPQIFTTDQLLDPAGPDSEKVDNERVAMMSREQAQKVIARLDLAANAEFEQPENTAPQWWKRVVPFGSLRQVAAWIAPHSITSQHAKSTAGSTAQSASLIDKVLSHVSVTRVGRSQVLAIDVEASQPGLAAAMANAWAAVYLEGRRNDKLAVTSRVETYLKARIGALRDQVQTADQAVEAYRQKNNLYRGRTANVTTEQLTDLNTQLILAQTAKAEADAKLKQAAALQHDGLDSSTDPSVLNSPIIGMLKQREAAAEQQLAQLQTTYGDRYPTVIKAKAEVTDLRRKMADEVTRILSGLKNSAQTADARYATLQHDFQNLQTRMGEVDGKSIHLEALERDATVDRNLLQALLSRAGETIGRQELEQPDAKLVSSAAPPLAPGFPPKKLIVLLGAIAGLLAGLFTALLRENADRTFRSADEVVAATGMPVIASVPMVGGGTPPAFHVLRHPMAAYSESLRKLYIALLLADAAHAPRTALVCSSVPSEGKSLLAASLARMLAWNGKRVLIIDCDWRSPSQHRVFRCSNQGGLASLMTDDNPVLHDMIFTDPPSGVDVLVAGQWTPRTSHMMASDRMRRVIETFASNYELVILDGPPVLAGADALPLARMVDKTVFAVRWGHTTRETVHDAMRQLFDVRADLVGVVFTRVDPKRYREFTYSNLNYEYARTSAS